MPIDQLLANLSITNIGAFFNAYPQGYPREKIQHELEELDALRSIAKQKAQELSQSLGIGLANPKSAFAQVWKPYANELKMSAQLAGDPNIVKTDDHDKPYFTYDGRNIDIHIQSTRSNNNFNPDNINEMFESILQAAIDVAHSSGHDRLLHPQFKQLKSEILNGITLPKAPKKRLKALRRFVTLSKSKQPNPHGSIIMDPEEVDNEEMSDLVNGTKLTRDSIDEIRKDLANRFKIPNEKLEPILKRCILLHKVFIGRLAIALWEADYALARKQNPNLPTNVLPDRKTYQAYIKRIQDQQIETASTTKRPIIITMYKQEVKDPEPNTSYYVMGIDKPNSDVSSASRSLDKMMFSNDWSVDNETIKVRHNPDGTISIERSLADDYIRSSSIASIKYSDAMAVLRGKKDLDETADKSDLILVYDSFKKMIRQYAREEMIRKLNNGESIDNILATQRLYISEAYITLLSPLLSKHVGKLFTPSIFKSLSIKTIHENEAAQLVSTRNVLNRLANETLRFSDLDAEEIIRRTGSRAPTTEDIQSLHIHHESYYCNYMVNKVVGIRSEKLDILELNKKYFLDGNESRRRIMLRHILSLPEIEHDNKEDFKNTLNSILSSRKPFIRKELQALINNYKYTLKDSAKTKKILNLYIDIEAYFDQDQKVSRVVRTYVYFNNLLRRVYGTTADEKDENERIAASYLAAYKDLKLAKVLGLKPHITCKSGVDRTGMFACFVEALAYVGDVIDMKILQNNILLSLQHGANRLIKSLNLPGIAGLQLPPNALSNMPLVAKFLSTELMSDIGKMGKTIFSHSRKIYALVRRTYIYDETLSRRSFVISTHDKPIVTDKRKSVGTTLHAPGKVAGTRSSTDLRTGNHNPTNKKR